MNPSLLVPAAARCSRRPAPLLAAALACWLLTAAPVPAAAPAPAPAPAAAPAAADRLEAVSLAPPASAALFADDDEVSLRTVWRFLRNRRMIVQVAFLFMCLGIWILMWRK